jgi:RNA polymerase sigma factor (sigma-70 family)
MNEELNNLAKEYSKTGNREVLTKIFTILQNLLKKKASFVFYAKTFHEGKITGHIKLNGKKIPVYKHNFKLSETGQTELADVQSELAIELIRILKKYKPEQDFETYLIGALWNWTPKFARKNKFFNYLKFNSMNVIDDTGKEKSLIDDIPQAKSMTDENFTDMFENLTENEIKIINLFQENGNIKQTEIAHILGVTKQRVKQILQGLQKKYVN